MPDSMHTVSCHKGYKQYATQNWAYAQNIIAILRTGSWRKALHILLTGHKRFT